MRKLISLGLGTVTAATMAFGMAAPAAHAVTATSTVCTAMPATQAAALAKQTLAQAGDDNANAAWSTAQNEFNSAVSDYVTALVNYIKAYDAGDGVAAAKATLDSAITKLSQKTSVYGQSILNKFSADLALQSAQFAVGVLNNIAAGLCV